MRLFTDILREHRNGKLVDHLSDRLQRVVKAVAETGKSGEITLKLKIVKAGGDDEAYEIIPNIGMKIPEKDLAKAMFFATDEGDLLRESPNAPSLFSGSKNVVDLGAKPGTGGESKTDGFGG